MVSKISYLLAILLACFLRVQGADLLERPSYIVACNRSIPSVELNSCLVGAFNHLQPYLVKGIPELNVPAIEPLYIHEMIMENGAGAVRVKARFSDINVKGPGNFSVREVRADVKNWRISLGLTIPRVEVSGVYDVNGNILLFPVRSRGEFWAAFSDINAVARIHGKEVARGGETFMNVGKLVLDFTVKGSRFKIRDTTNQENILGEAINQFLNQNGAEIINEMRPAASQSIGKLFRTYLDNAFSRIPVRLWLLE
ncbi:circadian clock-controlled protein-like [Ctenocephalides felis]|uniref:circadian clock-controlled protein-like n=1 Tax=Ctenocephalides felis TaxID=7515 RepID=UPI000E6E1A0D|nr:circadian clock-controlled protein-like [Ctenocephalides felis]